jgi:hypothetical protein
MRSSPTRSTEGGGSHHGLRGRWRGQAWAADEEVDTRKDNEVSEGGGLWCSSGFGSSPGGSSSSAASRAGPRCCETVRWCMDGAQAPEMGIRVGGGQ